MCAISSTSSTSSASTNRLTGLASGLDTDSIVESLMNAKKVPLNKLYQKKQLFEWQRDGYRSITTALKGFYDTYFNSLSSSNMTSASAYKKFTTATTDSTVVTATANADSIAGTHTIKVKQLATAASTSTAATTAAITGSDAAVLDYTGGNVNFNVTLNGQTKAISIQNILYGDVTALSSEIQSKVDAEFGSGKITVVGDIGTGKLSINTVSSSDRISLTGASSNDAIDSLKFSNGAANITTVTKNVTGTVAASLSYTDTNKNFDITIDGVTKTITLETSAYADVKALAKDVQEKIDSAFGVNKVAVNGDSTTGMLSIVSVTGNAKLTLTGSTSNNGLTSMGFTSGVSNRLNTSDTLADLASKFNVPLTFSGGYLNFTINGKYFSISSDKTLSDMMSTINSSTANVEMKYNSVTDKISITSKQKGAGDNIIISNTGGNLFDASAANSAIGIALGSYDNGVDSIFDLDGITDMTRGSNSFTIDGVTYNLQKVDAANTKTITVTQDNDSVYNNIKNFVDKYNEVITKINSLISEERDTDYSPLTDDQKEEMSDTEITNWETKAKSGLLRNDTILKKIVSDMRRAVYDTINGVSGSISDIGITTSSNYLDKGKLIIDETKLKEAIADDPTKVQNLFSKSSSINYSPTLTSGQSAQRYSEEGIANRFYDIIQNNIRTTRDSSGYKGYLVEKAGLVGDSSEYTNSITKNIGKLSTNISDMLDKLDEQQDKYYQLYANLETYISKMNAQSSWLSSQFSS